MNIQELTMLFGWMSIIHIVMLSFVGVALILGRGLIITIHHRMLGVTESELPSLYFKYFANYKLIALNTSIVPYVALKLMVWMG